MSADLEATADEVCASCGKAALDDVKLKKCACKLVKYCSVDCQKNHRSQHKKECKKRMAEIRDERLFRQPDESHLGECPICCLPLPIGGAKFSIKPCCFKTICLGCDHANILREEALLQHPKCPYCREPLPKSEEERDRHLMKRIKANDPVALKAMCVKLHDEGDYEGAFEYLERAAALEDMDAHYNLSVMNRKGLGVERDEKKKIYHLEEAAIGGHPYARYNLGANEGRNGRYERATKHFIIAAKLGYDDSLEAVKENFRRGFASKEDYAAALRGHQAAVDATKSKQREEAYAFFKKHNYAFLKKYNLLSGRNW